MSKLNFVQLCIEFCGYLEIFVWATNNHSGCWQIESLPLKKQPISSTKTLPSLWLFPLLKDIMVCTENRTQYFNLTRCYVHLPCVSDYRNHICIWADIFRENLHHDGGWTYSWCHPSGCRRCFPNYQKCNKCLATCLIIIVQIVIFLTDAFILFKVSKEGVPSQGFLHGDLQRNCDRSPCWQLEEKTAGNPRDHQCTQESRNCR